MTTIDIDGYGEGEVDIVELQGELYGIEAIDCDLVKEGPELHFDSFFLRGRLKDEEYTVIERVATDKGYVFRMVRASKGVYFFDKPPRYKISKGADRRDAPAQ